MYFVSKHVDYVVTVIMHAWNCT